MAEKIILGTLQKIRPQTTCSQASQVKTYKPLKQARTLDFKI